MRPAEIEIKINLAQKEADYWRTVLADKSCRHCEHGSRTSWCEKFSAVPPIEVQQAGCDEWAYDSIPF